MAYEYTLNPGMAYMITGQWKKDLEKYGGTVSGSGKTTGLWGIGDKDNTSMQQYKPDVNRIWEEDYEPAVAEYAAAGKEENINTLERELAKLRMRLGYNQSAGAGTAGWWNLARSNMLNAAAQKQFDINTDWQKWTAGQELAFKNMKDQQWHQGMIEAQRAYYHQQALKLQAELNDPTWWETLGTIVGYTGMLWGWAGFPMPNFGGGYKGDPNFP